MQGIGTAIGELPPYFMARAARLSGTEPDDEEYQEFEEMLEHAEGAQVRTIGGNGTPVPDSAVTKVEWLVVPVREKTAKHSVTWDRICTITKSKSDDKGLGV